MPLLIWAIIILIICIYCCPGFLGMMLTIGSIAFIAAVVYGCIKTKRDEKKFEKKYKNLPPELWGD
ncbi:MAG: hypothetical protein K1V80_01275 [Muribaculaceae bacterium]